MSHDEAVAALESFISQAKTALEALRRKEQHGDYDSVSWLDDD